MQNDHQALMKEIEKGIHEIHAHAREKKENERQTEEDKTVEGLYQRFSESSNKTILLHDSFLVYTRSCVKGIDYIVLYESSAGQ